MFDEVLPVADMRAALAHIKVAGATPFALFAETQLARWALERGDTGRGVESLSRIVDEGLGRSCDPRIQLPAEHSSNPRTQVINKAF